MEHPETLATIIDFIRGVGIAVETGALPEDGFLPAITMRDGRLVYDPERLQYPGDLLHEAGHIAVTDPALRPTISKFDSNGGDEMAAIGWSYAAALAAESIRAWCSMTMAIGEGAGHPRKFCRAPLSRRADAAILRVGASYAR